MLTLSITFQKFMKNLYTYHSLVFLKESAVVYGKWCGTNHFRFIENQKSESDENFQLELC